MCYGYWRAFLKVQGPKLIASTGPIADDATERLDNQRTSHTCGFMLYTSFNSITQPGYCFHKTPGKKQHDRAHRLNRRRCFPFIFHNCSFSRCGYPKKQTNEEQLKGAADHIRCK